MNHARTDGRRMSRRRMLCAATGAFGAAAAAAVAAQAAAQQRLNQAAVGYQSMPKGDLRCGACFNFLQPNACRFVQGTISPDGWCELFAAKT